MFKFWWLFQITEEDIRKTYGGGSTRGHYSSAYSPSTNAYMLMYRQINKERNCNAMSIEDFPPHIQNLLRQMKEKEENDRISREKESDMVKLRVYFYNPLQNRTVDTRCVTFVDTELNEVVKDAYERLKLESLGALEDCRVGSYNKLHDCIDRSFEDDTLKLCDILPAHMINNSEWMLEFRLPG